MNGVAFVDCFTALDDLPKKHWRDKAKVLAAIHAAGRFSAFDPVDRLAVTVTALFDEGYMKSVGGQYPWCVVELTPKGEALLATEK